MLQLRSIAHDYGSHRVLHDIDMAIGAGEIVCLLGPSGCGKTTLLRVIAGLEEGYQGDVYLDGKTIRHIPPQQRDFGMMFQDFALFPHLTVAQNVAFGLKMRGTSSGPQAQTVRDMLALVGLNGYEQRDISELSGGEKQRVALARSLAPQPRLLLLDEPLGSLDALLRERLAIELRNILKQVGMTAIYVTHDRQEAYAIADRIAIMNAGYIEQIATPEAIYHHPKTVFAARFLGLSNIVPVLHWTSYGAETAIGTFAVEDNGTHVLLHPDGISIADDGAITGIVTERVFMGDVYQYTINSAELSLTFKIPFEQANAKIGDAIPIAARHIVVLRDEKEKNRSIQ